MPNIDAHAHVSAPAELWAYKASLLSHRGAHGRGGVKISDDELIAAYHKKEMAPQGHIESMEHNHIDIQLISPRPFQMMHLEDPLLVQWFHEEVNNIIYRSTQLFPGRFYGVGMMPQAAGQPIEKALPELERCVKELGFVGTLVNPDPYENSGVEPPALGDRYWYPLYAKLCELDVPMHVHATTSRSKRAPYTMNFVNEETIAVFGLVNSRVFKDFPDLKVVVSHGGGAIPYQLGRFQSSSMTKPEGERFVDVLKKITFDTVLYSEPALRFLCEVIGSDNLVFGAECPGVGSKINPETNSTFDDIVPFIENMPTLSAQQKRDILENNARRLYKIPVAEPALAAT
jgi:predicted TIM-barrel fold metal-dependent hydrolase